MADISISAIVPVYNGEKYLREAIESILAQSYQAIEILVLDDGSTDNARAIAESFGDKIRYHYQANQGLGAARNAAIRLTQGDYLAFLDADDMWTEDKLALQAAVIREDSSVLMVAGYAENFLNPGLEEDIARQVHSSTEPQPASVVPAMLIHRSVFERAGPFGTSWKVGVDLDWFLRVKEQGIVVQMLPDVVLHRRIHAENAGIVHSSFASQRLEILKAALDRRRQLEASTRQSHEAEEQ